MFEAVKYNQLRERIKRLAGELLIADGKLEAVRNWMVNTKALCDDETFPWFELLGLGKILGGEVEDDA